MADTFETTTLRQDLDQLRQDFSTLKEDIKDSSRHQVRGNISAACNRVGGEIESRPYTSLLTALGAGLLLGKLFSR